MILGTLEIIPQKNYGFSNFLDLRRGVTIIEIV